MTLSTIWVESLLEKGFSSPTIKELTPDLSQMWFVQNGVDYVADLSPTGITNVSKAMFGDPTRFSRNKQEIPKAKKDKSTDVVDVTDDL